MRKTSSAAGQNSRGGNSPKVWHGIEPLEQRLLLSGDPYGVGDAPWPPIEAVPAIVIDAPSQAADASAGDVGGGAEATDVVIVTFPDAVLEAEIREALGQPDGDITDAALATLTELYAYRYGETDQIADLTGLEYCVNLTWLHLGYNQISDLTPLTGLSGLQYLYMYGNQISSLTPLAGMTGLKALYLSSNQINDLTPLAGLVNLESLALSDNQISNLTPLAGMTQLVWLDLNNNQVADLTPLAGLTALDELRLTSNQISSLAGLSGLTALDNLTVSFNPLSDLTPLAGLTGLASLDLSWSQISDCTPLAGMVGLHHLSLGGNQISDLSPLAGMASLEHLYLAFNQISDLTPLAGMTSLMGLLVNNNAISDLTPLAGLVNMGQLSLSANQITDVNPLAGMTALYRLNLANNHISDLTPLVNNPGLGAGDSLDLRNNPLNEAAYTTDLPALAARGFTELLYGDDLDVWFWMEQKANYGGLRTLREYEFYTNVGTDGYVEITDVSFQSPAGEWYSLEPDGPTNWSFDMDQLGTVEQLEALFPAGTYTFEINGPWGTETTSFYYGDDQGPLDWPTQEPVPIDPLWGQADVGLAPLLSWQPITDPAVNAIWYRVGQADEDASGVQIDQTIDATADSQQIIGLDAATFYEWSLSLRNVYHGQTAEGYSYGVERDTRTHIVFQTEGGVPGEPDLLFEVTDYTPGTYEPGDPLAFDIRGGNQGDGLGLATDGQGNPLPIVVEVRMSTDTIWGNADDVIVFAPVDGYWLPHDVFEESDVMLPVPDDVAPGSYYMAVFIDATEVLPESDETNNVWWSPAADFIVVPPTPRVVSQQVFYNDSSFDGDAAASITDDAAIAADKRALLPDGVASFANVTSYSRGINGIMLDTKHLAATPTAGDFTLKVGNTADPATWSTYAGPMSVDVRPGEGVNGSDRITLIFPDHAIENTWLQVTVLSDANGGSLGLPEDDVFYFGNLVGETGDDWQVTQADGDATRTNQSGFATAAVDSVYDHNRDGHANVLDIVAAKQSIGNTLIQLTAPAIVPAAAPAPALFSLESQAATDASLVSPAVPAVTIAAQPGGTASPSHSTWLADVWAEHDEDDVADLLSPTMNEA